MRNSEQPFFVSSLIGDASASPLNLERIRMPEGFGIEVYADDVPGARSLALSPSCTLFVGTRRHGKVYAIVDVDGSLLVSDDYAGAVYRITCRE